MSGVKALVGFLTTRLLRSRLGVALGIAVVVLGIVGAARLVAGPAGSDAPGVVSQPRQPVTTVDPGAGNDAAVSGEPTPTPRTRPGAAVPETVARRFATAWLRHQGVSAKQWHDALVPHATRELAGKLTGVDPAGVPADRLTGDPVVIPRTDELVEVTLPVDTGRLRLRLVGTDGRWLVDGVDWERA